MKIPYYNILSSKMYYNNNLNTKRNLVKNKHSLSENDLGEWGFFVDLEKNELTNLNRIIGHKIKMQTHPQIKHYPILPSITEEVTNKQIVISIPVDRMIYIQYLIASICLCYLWYSLIVV
jgi:hypothetical protein